MRRAYVQSPENALKDRLNSRRIRVWTRDAAKTRDKVRAHRERHKSAVNEALAKQAREVWKAPRLLKFAVWAATDRSTGERIHLWGTMTEPTWGARATRWAAGRDLTVVRVLGSLSFPGAMAAATLLNDDMRPR